MADCTKEVKETRICGWKCSSTFTTTMIQSIWKTYILPEMGHHGSLQDAGYWERVSLYWTRKYIHKATTHLGDSQQAAKEFIYGAINERDFDGVMRLLQKCYASTDQEYKKKEVTECTRYIKNNWLGIMVRIDDGGAVWGCSAEGHISHVLSARESSRPMGWSKKGVDRISRVRVLTRNEQKIIDLMEYQDKKQRKKNRIECEDQFLMNLIYYNQQMKEGTYYVQIKKKFQC